MASLINFRPSQVKSIILNIWAKTAESAGGAGADDGDDHTGSNSSGVNSTSRNARLFTALVRSSLHSPSSQPWCSTQSPKRAPLISACKCSARRPRLYSQVLSAIPEASASDLLDLDLEDLGASERAIWDPEVKSGRATVAPSLVACKWPPSACMLIPLSGCMQIASLIRSQAKSLPSRARR